MIDFVAPAFNLNFFFAHFSGSGDLGYTSRTQSKSKSARIYFGHDLGSQITGQRNLFVCQISTFLFSRQLAVSMNQHLFIYCFRVGSTSVSYFKLIGLDFHFFWDHCGIPGQG